MSVPQGESLRKQVRIAELEATKVAADAVKANADAEIADLSK